MIKNTFIIASLMLVFGSFAMAQHTPEVNIALGKPATQSSNIGAPYDVGLGLASVAVDGNTNGDWFEESVTHTTDGGTFQPWWQVDLGADYDINKIQIWNRTDCCQERLTNYRIWTKTESGGWEEFAPGLKNYRVGETYPLTFSGNKRARILRVQIEGDGILSLAEVKVFSAPPMGQISPIDNLEVDFISNYSQVWNDKASGANLDVSFWRPEPSSGWFRVGHHLKNGYGKPTELTMVVRANTPDSLAKPIDYEAVWNDAGSGATQNGSVWRPICPNGYRALGDVTSGSHMKPNIDEVMCVRQSALVAALPGNPIWNDAGSGAKLDFGSWSILPPASDSRFTYMSRGLFYGAPSHSRPALVTIFVWAIKLPR